MESVASAVNNISKKVGYIVHYKDHIKDLEATVLKLKDWRVHVMDRVVEARRNLNQIEPRVENWLSSVDNILQLVTTFLEHDEIRGVRNINLKSRYDLSRKATKVKAHVLALLQEARDFTALLGSSSPPPVSRLDLDDDDDIGLELESRKLIIRTLLEALMDDQVRMITILGMGGIGKTTTAQHLVKVIQERKVMDVICWLHVSQNPDLGRIQNELADSLGLKFDRDSLYRRAEKLRSAFMQQDRRTLLILDDVWEPVDLETIGVPLPGEANGVKILLTSRNQDVCKRMGSQRNFYLGPMTEEEALNLFKRRAYLTGGDDVDTQEDMHELAREIVRCCEGLPLAIITIASSLRNRQIDDWRHALEKLRTSSLQGISAFDEVYYMTKSSYDLLLTEEQKSCFLLCCLFPKNSSILLEDLVRYGICLGLFGDTDDNFFQARERVHFLIHELKQAALLLEGDDTGGDSVRMHDIVRDFAISIASKDKSYVCCDDVNINRLNTDMLRSSRAMSLIWEATKECPVVSQCPNLMFLLFVSRKSSESVNFFFQGIKTGGLGNLVVLAIKTQSSPNLPEEIGLLTNLRLLDLGGMSGLKYVPPGVLSKLSKLKQLYVTPEFRRWGCRVEGEDGERINASLSELEFLPIIALQISALNASILPKLHFFKKLVHCEIRLDNTLLSIGGKSNNELVLEGDASYVKESGMSALLNKIAKLRLVRVENVKSFELFIDDIKQIPTSPDIQLQYFCNLTFLAMESCGDLKHVFPLSIATTLSKIQKIRISDCIKMEGILYGEGQIKGVEFPCLTTLELIGVPNLNGFWVDIDNAGAGLLPYQSSDDDTAMKSSTPYCKGASSSMAEPNTETKSSLVAEIECVHSSFGLFPSWIQLSNLEEFRLQGCRLLRMAFPSSVAEQLVKLRILEIKWCCKMEYIVGGREEKYRRSSISVFPELTSFIIDDLPELMAFSAESHIYLERISLDELKVSKCPKIKTLFETLPPDYDTTRQDKIVVSTNEVLFKIPWQFKGSINVKFLEVRLCDNATYLFSSRAAKFLMGLERIEIRYCDKMKEIVGKGEEDEEVTKEVFLSCDLLSLESITVDGCFQLKTFSYKNSFNTPNLKELHINGSQYQLVEDLNTTIENVMLSKSRVINMKQLETLWHVQIPDKDWSRIRDLEIQGCDKLLSAIPCNLIVRLQKLEKLVVRWCDSLEEIFQYEGAIKLEGESAVTFSHLEEITLFDLQNLKHIFISIPKTIIGFQKLRKLYVHGCHSLRNIFSVSSVRGLLQLQELKVSSCNELKEIVAKDDKEEQAGRESIVFPRLRSINISDSSTLERFYSGIYDLVMPLLESLHLNRCPSIKKFSNGSLTAPKLQKVQGDCKETSLIRTSPIVDLDEIIAKKKKRTQLRIYNRNGLQNIGHDQLPYEDLSQIQDLEIQACNKLLCAIPCNLIENDLQKLEKLVVRRCPLLEEIFEHRGANLGSGSITTFCNLEEITLFDLGKLQHVFYDIPEATVLFQKLRKLHIHGCDSLRNVFSVSTVKGLPELQELKLSSCEGLEEIVAEGERQKQGIKDKIDFPQLRSIDICYSSKLVCFYSGNYALELPKLESLFLYKCPRMSFFAKGLLATGSLQKVQIDNANYKLLQDDLNDTMKYKDLLLRREDNSQGLEEPQQDLEIASRSSAQIYRNSDGSTYSAVRMRIAELEQENEMLKRQLASKQ